ncbi:MAG: TatD family hydrolase [Rhodospirillales bacterium]|nr:TatD family hydrolase [Rhodospirillales bacterium]
MLIDSHCHLDHADFEGEIEAIIARAHQAGVMVMLSISTSLRDFPRVLEIAERNAGVFCTVGVHPHDAAAEATVTTADLVRLAAHPKVVGIGECGLDFFYNRSPQDVQKHVFRAHIRAARETGLPLVVHTRDADDVMAAILIEEQAAGHFGGVLHCFSSGAALAETAIRLGLYISFSGILTFKKSEPLRAIAQMLPLDRLLVETDAPYLAPVPMRGRRNEPSFVGHTLASLAVCRNETVASLTAATGANFRRLFAKAAIPASE